MADYYPPLGFHFLVEFTGFPGEHQFQSVNGLSVDVDTESIAEGGENRFKHKLPLRTRFPNMVLKRGLVTDSELIEWCRDAVENFSFKPINLMVKLLNEKHEPLASWNIVHAYPVKLSMSDFNAEENRLAIETIELSYNYFTRM